MQQWDVRGCASFSMEYSIRPSPHDGIRWSNEKAFGFRCTSKRRRVEIFNGLKKAAIETWM